MIDETARDIIAPELMDGEELLWASRQHNAPYSSNGHLVFWAFFLVASNVAMIWLAYKFAKKGDYLELLLVGLGLALMAYLLVINIAAFSKAKVSNMVYTITNKRIFLKDNDENHSILPKMVRAIYSNHSEHTSTLRLLGPGVDDEIFEIVFEHVENGVQAEKLLLEKFLR